MLEAAQVERQVAIVLQIANDENNKTQAEKFKKSVFDAEKSTVAAAKDSSKKRVDILKAETGQKLGIINKANKSFIEVEKRQTSVVNQEARKRVEIKKREGADITTEVEKIQKTRLEAEAEGIRAVEEASEKKKRILDKETRDTIAAEKKKSEAIKQAHEQRMNSNRQATEATLGALQGTMDLAEGLAILGISSEENFEAFARGFIKIQAGFKAIKGLTELIWKAREALLAMESAQAAVTAGNKAMAATAVASGSATVAGEILSGTGAGVAGVATDAIIRRRAAQAAGSSTGEAVAGGIGQAIGGAAVGVGGIKASSAAARAAGGTTIGGAVKSGGRLALQAGRGVLGGAKAVGGKIAGASATGAAALLATGGLIAGAITEGIGMVRARSSSGSFRGEARGGAAGGGSYFDAITDLSQILNESPIGASLGFFRARRQAGESETQTEKLHNQEQQKRDTRTRFVESENLQFEAERGQRSSRLALQLRKIQSSEGTDIERASALELFSIKEVEAARKRVADSLEEQHQNQLRGLGFINEIQLGHLDELREREENLLAAQQAKLAVLKSQNEAHKQAVATSKTELKVAEERLKNAQATARSDQDSKLAAFDRLSAQQKFDVREIAEKRRRGEALNQTDVRKLESAGFRKEADRFRANRARRSGVLADIRTLGELETSDKNLTKAREDEETSRNKLNESIQKENESREKIVTQSERVSASLQKLSETVDRLVVMQANTSGANLSNSNAAPVVEAINANTDSAVSETVQVVDAIRNLGESTNRNFQEIREEIDATRHITDSYAKRLRTS